MIHFAAKSITIFHSKGNNNVEGFINNKWHDDEDIANLL